MDSLLVENWPKLQRGRMVLAFSGWMDGGDVSTGTVQRIVDQVRATPFASIDPESYYIYNFPGAMEVTALFRPHIRIEGGLVREYRPPTNRFYGDEGRNLAFFIGKEPNLNWRQFGDCIFALAARIDVSLIIFVGSFGGSVPHTREPRLYATVSDAQLLAPLERYGVRPSDYEGPGSFTSFLMTQAEARGFEMISLVAEIPGYLQGTNPLSIEAVTRRLAAILNLSIDLSELRGASDEWESRVSDAVAKSDDLAKQIRDLEERYDDELIGNASDVPGWPVDDDEVPSDDLEEPEEP